VTSVASLRDHLREQVSWLVLFVNEELAPYADRGALVARMVTASTAVMLATMIFRIPFGSHGAIYTFLISRESPRSTLRAALTLVMVVSASAVFALIGSILSSGDPTLRLLWVVAALFVLFFAISAMPDYATATGFGLAIVIPLSLWDEVISPELKVENTLWVLGQTTLACVVTVAVEVAFAAWKSRDEVTDAIAERLSAVATVLECAADGHGAADAKRRLTRLAWVGVSRLQQHLRRSSDSTSQAERMAAAVAVVGRMVDIAANMAAAGIAPSGADRARLHAIARSIVNARRDLLLDRAPRVDGEPDALAASDTVPLLPELAKTVSLLGGALAAPEIHDAYALRPGRERPWFRPDALSNPDHIKFALKGCLAASLCYVLYTAVKWPGISTAVVTCLFTALTSIGGSRQKQTLRIGGAIAGAIVAIGAQVFILPHVDSIGGFTLLFVAVTAGAAWIATSTPRLSYFGVQFALAFYVVHLQEFSMQTSLAVARDRIVGILLGLFMMWIVFDQLWGLPASLALKRQVISTFRLLARLVREPLTTETRAAVDRVRALRATINASFDGMRALADGVLFEFGPSRRANLAWRRRILEWNPQLHLVFLTRVALVKYRLGVPGFELPTALGAAQVDFDCELANRLDNIADRLEDTTATPDALDHALAQLEHVSRFHDSPFLPLSRRIASLTASLDEAVRSALDGPS
jgi:multidrug resistance protein MdtO